MLKFKQFLNFVDCSNIFCFISFVLYSFVKQKQNSMTNKQKQTKKDQENALLSIALIILLLLACLADNL